ncbi:response regulator [Candidatus Wolfebacteria bacterium]|nr:response regulator [Candidatus Wolfebacteria bacterium]
MTDQKTVLIVDDEQDVRDVLATALQDAGFATLMASDGEEGLAVALDRKPDVVLLDIIMPNMDGWEMFDRLRKDAWGKTANVLFLTNVGDMESVSRAIDHGGKGYLMKADMKLEDVVKKVEECLV